MIARSNLALILLAILISCSRNNPNCHFQGELKNCESQEKIYLVDDESNEIVDSSFLKNGTFEFNIDLLHEKPFTLHNKRNQYEVKDRKRIWLEPGNIFLTGDNKLGIQR